MTRISSPITFYYRRIFPILALVIGAIVMLFAVVGNRGSFPPWPFVLGLAFITLTAYAVTQGVFLELVDEVWDVGDALVVRKGTAEERISLTDIKNVSYSRAVNFPRVTLSLRQSGQLGSEVTFLAPAPLYPSTKSPIVGALIDRIDAARSR